MADELFVPADFTYTVLSAGTGESIGCAYIYPARTRGTAFPRVPDRCVAGRY
jgi:hypothetical protein